jgi:hypothetical protein
VAQASNPTRHGASSSKHHLAAPELLSDNDILLAIYCVYLEYVLGDIQTNRGNLHVDGSLDVIRLTTITLWHFDADTGAVHHINR